MTDDYVKKVALCAFNAGVDHGKNAVGSLSREQVEEFLGRLIAIVPKPDPVVYKAKLQGGGMALVHADVDGAIPLYAEPVVSLETVNARLLALLTGLEAGPLFAQAEPHQLLELGKAIAAQAKSAAEQSKPVPELTDARIQQLWNENAGHTPNWNRHSAFARAIERELRENLND